MSSEIPTAIAPAPSVSSGIPNAIPTTQPALDTPPFPPAFEPGLARAPPSSAQARSASAPTDVAPHTRASKTIKKAKGNSSGAGVPNYNNEDISAMLDAVEVVEPLGSNHWAMVAEKFKAWAMENDRPEREQDSLKNKFDKLANAKKKTGDPSCPPNVRRAKHIARDILAKCAAMTLADSSSSNGEEDGDKDVEMGGSGEGVRSGGGEEYGDGSGSGGAEVISKTVGERSDKRKPGFTGTSKKKKEKTEDIFVAHIGNMATMIGGMVKVMKAGKEFHDKLVTRADVTGIVKAEVTESLRPTNTMLSEMHQMLSNMGGNGGDGDVSDRAGDGA